MRSDVCPGFIFVAFSTLGNHEGTSSGQDSRNCAPSIGWKRKERPSSSHVLSSALGRRVRYQLHSRTSSALLIQCRRSAATIRSSSPGLRHRARRKISARSSVSRRLRPGFVSGLASVDGAFDGAVSSLRQPLAARTNRARAVIVIRFNFRRVSRFGGIA